MGGYNFDIGSNSQLQTKLEGSWVRLVNDIQEESQANLNLPPYQNDIDWVQYDNSYQKEESNVYYHVNRIHDFFVRGEEPFNMLGLNYQMIANVELDGDCNAYATGDSINFFRPGQCEPLSLYSDVIYHEYTHNMVARVAPQLSSVYWGETGNMNEGYADYYSCSLNNNSCLTEGFLGMSCMRNCENTKRYPEDYGDEPHYAAEVVSGALWDIRQAVGQEKGDELALLALSMDPQTFSELATNYLIVDDAVYGNGDLSDGTPDIEAICDSFYMNHGVYSIYCFNDLPLVARMINLPSYTSMDSYIDLEGVAGGTNFDHYNLSFRKEGSSSENEIISSLLRTSAEGDVLYIGFNASLLENGKNHIILRVWDSFGNSIEEVNVIFMDRFLKKGWPVVFNGLGGSYGPSLLADLNGDGMKEIVLAGTMNPRVHLFQDRKSVV